MQLPFGSLVDERHLRQFSERWIHLVVRDSVFLYFISIRLFLFRHAFNEFALN